MFLLFLLFLSCAAPEARAESVEKDLRTKEQRLYDIQLRRAQWSVDRARLQMEEAQSNYEETKSLYEKNIRTLEELNQDQRDYKSAEFEFLQAQNALERERLSFLRKATHISILEAKKYRTQEGYREIQITLKNNSNLNQAVALTQKMPDEARNLLEVQNIRVSIQDDQNTLIAEPYETIIPSLKLYDESQLTFRLLEDTEEAVVVLNMLSNQAEDPFGLEAEEDHHIVLRKESLQDIPTINSVQFSQEGDLNSSVRYDLILERLAEDEKTFRLAVVNLPAQIDFKFLDQATNASLTQVKFSEESTRQQLELELEIPEKLSRDFVDQTIEFYVFITDQEGFKQIGDLNHKYGTKNKSIEAVNTVKGNKERFELVPRGQGELETIITNRYQEVKIGEEVSVRVELLNPGTLAVEGVHLALPPPLGWTYGATPDTIPKIEPADKEPVNITLYPPEDLGVSEYDVRIEAVGFVGNEKIEAQEKDITVRVEARADIVTNALIIGFVIALVIGVAYGSIKVSRR